MVVRMLSVLTCTEELTEVKRALATKVVKVTAIIDSTIEIPVRWTAPCVNDNTALSRLDEIRGERKSRRVADAGEIRDRMDAFTV